MSILGKKRAQCAENRTWTRKTGAVSRAFAIFLSTLILVALVLAVVMFGLRGREKKPAGDNGVAVDPSTTNRALDATYQLMLRDSARKQNKVVMERNRVLAEQAEIERQIQAALPEGTDAETLKAAFKKDQRWQALQAKRDELNGQIQTDSANVRKAIRNRIEQEQKVRNQLAVQDAASKSAGKVGK